MLQVHISALKSVALTSAFDVRSTARDLNKYAAAAAAAVAVITLIIVVVIAHRCCLCLTVASLLLLLLLFFYFLLLLLFVYGFPYHMSAACSHLKLVDFPSSIDN